MPDRSQACVGRGVHFAECHHDAKLIKSCNMLFYVVEKAINIQPN